MRKFVRALALGAAVAGAVLALAGQAGANSAPTISLSYYHSCAVAVGGAVKCWGQNVNGEVGDGTTTTRRTPVTVPGITGATAVSTGTHFSCAIVTGGQVKCWGANEWGQLGNGDTLSNQSLTPVTVSGLSNVIAIDSGELHTCAAVAGGSVYCWGYNGQAQIGDGTTTSRWTPVLLSGITGAVSVDVGPYHSCALQLNGLVKCWGSGFYGQQGDNNVNGHTTPTTLPGVNDAIGLAASGGLQTCVQRATGNVLCTGFNDHGQLGMGTVTFAEYQLRQVALINDATQIANGAENGCAIRAASSVWCWGWNGFGHLGDGTTTESATPVQSSGFAGLPVRVSVSSGHVCVLTIGGALWCIGLNVDGQLGNGSNAASSPVYVQVSNLVVQDTPDGYFASRVGSSAAGAGYLLQDTQAANVEANRVRFDYAYRGGAAGSTFGKQLTVRWTQGGDSFVFRASSIDGGALYFFSAPGQEGAFFSTVGTVSRIVSGNETVVGSGYKVVLRTVDNNPGVTGNAVGSGIDAVSLSIYAASGSSPLLSVGSIGGPSLTYGNVGSLR